MKRSGWMIALCVLLLCLTACSGSNGNGGNKETNGHTENASAANSNQEGEASGGESSTEPNNTGEDVEKAAIVLPTGPVKLVIASFEPSEQLKVAVEKYEQAHPNVTVELQAAQTEFKDLDSQIANLEKYVSTTNTALLSGKGPDLMELDYLPKEKYVGRGLLADLNDFMERDADFEKSNYFVNILDNSALSGGLYALPLSFYPVQFIGDEAAIVKDGGVDDADWTWKEFADTAMRLRQQGTYDHALASTPEYMLSELVGERYAQFVDEVNREANFDSPEFAELMEQVKKLFTDGVILDFTKNSSGGKGGSRLGSAKINTYFQSTQVPSPMEFLLMMDDYDGHAKLYTIPHAKDMGSGGYFQANQTIGINAASSVKEQAWDFVKFLLSEQGAADPDTSLGHTGFPISKLAYQKEIQKLRDDGEVPAYKNGPAEMDAFKVDEEKLDLLDSIVTSAVHPVDQPSEISDLITEESKAFFAGQKSAEAVAKLIQNKVTTYLNE